MILSVVIDFKKLDKFLRLAEKANKEKKWQKDLTEVWIYLPSVIMAIAMGRDELKDAIYGVGTLCGMWEVFKDYAPQKELDKILDEMQKSKDRLGYVFFEILTLGPEEGIDYFVTIWNNNKIFIEKEKTKNNALHGFGNLTKKLERTTQ